MSVSGFLDRIVTRHRDSVLGQSGFTLATRYARGQPLRVVLRTGSPGNGPKVFVRVLVDPAALQLTVECAAVVAPPTTVHLSARERSRRARRLSALGTRAIAAPRAHSKLVDIEQVDDIDIAVVRPQTAGAAGSGAAAAARRPPRRSASAPPSRVRARVACHRHRERDADGSTPAWWRRTQWRPVPVDAIRAAATAKEARVVLGRGRLSRQRGVDFAASELRALLLELRNIVPCDGYFPTGAPKGGTSARTAIDDACADLGCDIFELAGRAEALANEHDVMMLHLQFSGESLLHSATHVHARGCALLSVRGGRRCGSCGVKNSANHIKQLLVNAHKAATDARTAHRVEVERLTALGVSRAEFPLDTSPYLAEALDLHALTDIAGRNAHPAAALYAANRAAAQAQAAVRAEDDDEAVAAATRAQFALDQAEDTARRERERVCAVWLLDSVDRLERDGKSTQQYHEDVRQIADGLLSATSNGAYRRVRELLPFYLPHLATVQRWRRSQTSAVNDETLQIYLTSFVAALDADAALFVEHQKSRHAVEFPLDLAKAILREFIQLEFDEMTCHRVITNNVLTTGRANGALLGVGRINTTAMLVASENHVADGVLLERVATCFLNFSVRTLFAGTRGIIASFPVAGASDAAQVLLSLRLVESTLQAAGLRVVMSAADSASAHQAIWRTTADIDSLDAQDLIFAQREFHAEQLAQRAGADPVDYRDTNNRRYSPGQVFRSLGGGRSEQHGAPLARDPMLRPNFRKDDRHEVYAALKASLAINDRYAGSEMFPDSTHMFKRVLTAVRRKRGITLGAANVDDENEEGVSEDNDVEECDNDDDDRDGDDNDADDDDDDDADDKCGGADDEPAAKKARRFTRFDVRDCVRRFGGGRRQSADQADVFVGPRFVHSSLFDEQVLGIAVSARQRSRMSMDPMLAKKLFDPALLDIVKGYINGELEQVSDADKRVREQRYGPLRDFLTAFGPFAWLLMENSFVNEKDLARIGQLAGAANAVVQTSDMPAALRRDFAALLNLWTVSMTRWFKDVDAMVRAKLDDDGARRFEAQTRTGRVTTDWLERVHGLARGKSSAMSTVTQASMATTANAINTRAGGSAMTQKAVQQARNRVRRVHKKRRRAAEKARASGTS